MSDALLTRRDVEALLKVSRATLFRIQDADESFPEPLNLGGSAKLQRWRAADVAAWLETKAPKVAA